MIKIFSILLLISFTAGAQTRATATNQWLKDNPQLTGTVIRIDTSHIAPRKRDTIQVLMLLCDTLLYASSTMGYFSEEAQAMNDGRAAFWDFGYSVREIHNEQEGRIDWYFDHQRAPQDYGVHLYYLNSRKQPLAKNIIVWQRMNVQ